MTPGELLSRAVRMLADDVDAHGSFVRLAGLVVPAAADWCLVDLLEPPDLVTRVAAVGPDGPLTLPAELGPVDARRSSAQARGVLTRLVDAPGRRLRIGAADLQGLLDADDPRLAGQARLALSLGTSDLLVLGLAAGGELLGVLSVGRVGGSFTAADLDLLQDVAAVSALALDRLRLSGVQRDVSTALQRSLLPALPVVAGLTLAARFVQTGSGLAVGGDWYDALTLPGGDMALVIGDVTGHDAQAAARMAELRNLLRAVAVDRQDGPAATLTRLDTLLAQVAPELSGTCLYARITRSTVGARLIWSCAGHLPPLLLRDGRAVLLETEADLMLGVDAGTGRHDHVRELVDGDVVVLYTDGLVEQRRTGLDERLRALTAFAQTCAPHPEGLVDSLVTGLAGGEDDVAVLAVRLDTT